MKLELDTNIAALVHALNSLEGIQTFGSCGGHKDHDDSIGQRPENEWFVTFTVADTEAGRRSLECITTLCNFIEDTRVDVCASLFNAGAGLLYGVEGKGSDPQQAVDKLTEFKGMSLDEIMATFVELVYE